MLNEMFTRRLCPYYFFAMFSFSSHTFSSFRSEFLFQSTEHISCIEHRTNIVVLNMDIGQMERPSTSLTATFQVFCFLFSASAFVHLHFTYASTSPISTTQRVERLTRSGQSYNDITDGFDFVHLTHER